MKKLSMKRHKIALCVFLVLLILFALLFGYAYFNGRSGLRHNPDPQAGDICIACVGDSITYGSTVSNWPQNNYPKVLDDLLGDGYTVCNYGISGGCLLSTSDKPYRNTDVYPLSQSLDPHIVVLMLGTNDSKTENWTNAADFKEQMIALIEDYRALPSAPTICLCTPCKAYSDIYSIQESEISQIVPIIHEICAEYDLTLIDIRTLSENHPEWFAKDGVHPNNDGAAAIARAVAQAIKGE